MSTTIPYNRDQTIDKFNENIDALSVQLSKLYPDRKNVLTYIGLASQAKKINREALIKNFDAFVYDRFGAAIMKGDEQAILNFDFSSMLGKSEHTQNVNSFKELWSDQRTTESNKKSIIKYFQVFIKLVEFYRAHNKK